MLPIIAPWIYPEQRYYYGWWDVLPTLQPTDGEIKATVVDRLRNNPLTKHDEIRVDVKQRVVILEEQMSCALAKRAAGDDAWDTPGVADVSHHPDDPSELSVTATTHATNVAAATTSAAARSCPATST